jgi:hypothetical protein
VCSERAVDPTSNNPKARHQQDQILSILFANGCELQPHSLTFFRMPHGRVGANRAFLHEEMQVGDGADSLRLSSFDESPADAQVTHARDIVAAIASPVDPHVLRSRDAARESLRRCRCRQRLELEKAFHASPRI